MNTLKLYSMLKVNQKKAKETKYNHTRIILAISATIIAILCMASCATDKSKYHFDSSKMLLPVIMFTCLNYRKRNLCLQMILLPLSATGLSCAIVFILTSVRILHSMHILICLRSSIAYMTLSELRCSDLPLDKTEHSKTFLESRSPPHNIIMRRTSKPLLTQPKRFMPLLTALKFSKSFVICAKYES